MSDGGEGPPGRQEKWLRCREQGRTEGWRVKRRKGRGREGEREKEDKRWEVRREVKPSLFSGSGDKSVGCCSGGTRQVPNHYLGGRVPA